MFANRKNQKLRLAVATQQSPVDFPHSSTFTLPGETEFPAPPAMPDALLRLDLCLSAFVVDLQDIKDIIRTDVGLTLQLLRLAARQTEQSPGRIGSIGEIAIQVGVPGLRELVSRTRALNFTSHAGLSVCERFWSHARLTALIAEELAGQSSEVDPEQAYLAGLLCNVGDLPSILGWATTASGAADSRHGYRMAKAWELPRVLADVIGGCGEVCLSPESRALLDVAEAADNWASRLESMAVCEAMRAD